MNLKRSLETLNAIMLPVKVEIYKTTCFYLSRWGSSYTDQAVLRLVTVTCFCLQSAGFSNFGYGNLGVNVQY